MKRYSYIFILLAILISFSGCKDSSADRLDDLHYESNDINKLFSLNYMHDEYQLFYQEPKQAGAKLGILGSKNGVVWERREIKSQPDSLFRIGPCCMVNDFRKSSGLSDQNDLMLLYSLDQNMFRISYSNDLGASWVSWKDSVSINTYDSAINAMKIVWDEADSKWILVLVRNYNVDFYNSSDLLKWEYCSSFSKDRIDRDGDWNTIDFFPVKIQDSSELKWTLVIGNSQGAPNYGLGAQYFVGDFKNFVFDTREDVKWLDAGTDFFFPIVLSDYLMKDKQPTMVARVDNSYKLSLLRTFHVKFQFGEYHFDSDPVFGSEHFDMDIHRISATTIDGELEIKKEIQFPCEIVLNFDLKNRKYLDFAKSFGLIMNNEHGDKLVVGYHNYNRYFFIYNNDEIVYAPAVLEGDEVKLKILMDKNCIEFFSSDGLTSMVKLYRTNSPLTDYRIFAEEGKMNLKNASISDIK